jgi:hypothetical protein
MDTDLLSVSEFAKALGKCRKTVMKLIHAREIVAEDHSSPGSSQPLYKIERKWIRLWRQSRRVGGSAPTMKIETPSGIREVDVVIF